MATASRDSQAKQDAKETEEASPRISSFVRDYLLQRHQSYLSRINYSAMLNRMLSLSAAVALQCVAGSRSFLLAISFAAIALTLIWYMEQRWLGMLLTSLERLLAEKMGGESEDAVIKYQHETRYGFSDDKKSNPKLFRFYKVCLRFEPFAWTFVIIMSAVLAWMYYYSINSLRSRFD